VNLTIEEVTAMLRLLQQYVPGCAFCQELATHTVSPNANWRGTPCCDEHVEAAKRNAVESYKVKRKTFVQEIADAKYARMLRGVVTQVCLDCVQYPCECIARPEVTTNRDANDREDDDMVYLEDHDPGYGGTL